MLEGLDKDVSVRLPPRQWSPSANPVAQLIFQMPRDFPQPIVSRQREQVLRGLGKKYI